jgi:hypothetical protein
MSSLKQFSKPVPPPPPPHPPPLQPPSIPHSPGSAPIIPSTPASGSAFAGQQLEQNDYKSNDVTVFTWNGNNRETIEFEFPRLEDKNGSISLRNVVTQYVGALQSRKITAEKLFQILGRLRCLQDSIDRYNSGLLSQTQEFLQYWRRHKPRC